MRTPLILSIALILALTTAACTKKEFIQSTATLGGAAVGILIGNGNVGKAIGGALGAGAGYFVGGLIGDYFDEKEQTALNNEIQKDLKTLDKEQAGEGKWSSEETPTKKVNMTYSKEETHEVAPASTPDSNSTAQTATLCREATVTIEKDEKPVGSQKQLWCRTAEGDYMPNGEPYDIETALVEQAHTNKPAVTY